MKNEPWIVIFPGMVADAPVYSNQEAALAMVERTKQETAGNVEAIAMPLAVAASAMTMLDALVKIDSDFMVDSGFDEKHIRDQMILVARKAATIPGVS